MGWINYKKLSKPNHPVWFEDCLADIREGRKLRETPGTPEYELQQRIETRKEHARRNFLDTTTSLHNETLTNGEWK